MKSIKFVVWEGVNSLAMPEDYHTRYAKKNTESLNKAVVFFSKYFCILAHEKESNLTYCCLNSCRRHSSCGHFLRNSLLVYLV